MNILCKLFGHKPPVYAETGWAGSGHEYGIMKDGFIDNIHRIHVSLYADCARCHENFFVMRSHLNGHAEKSAYQVLKRKAIDANADP